LPSLRTLSLGVVQFGSAGSPEESLKRLQEVLEDDTGTDVLLLPEYSDVNIAAHKDRESILRAAKPIEDNPFIAGLSRIAGRLGAHILAGVLERADDCLYSSVVAVTPRGDVVLVYRKRVLFDALGYRESSLLCPGDLPPTLLSLRSWSIGAVVCFEIRFPEIARALALSGAQLLAVPAAWYGGPGKEEQLRFLAQARASENTVYLAVADQAGAPFAARSLVVDPYGLVRLDLGVAPAYNAAVLDQAELVEVRRRLPLLELSARALEAARVAVRHLKLRG